MHKKEMSASFVVCPGALPRDELEKISHLFSKAHENPASRFAGQSGFLLRDWEPELQALQALDSLCSEYVGAEVAINYNKSSCRRQRPDGEAKLALHQDNVALGIDDPNAKCLVAWVPLCDIDDLTPSLDICPINPGRFVEHIFDERRYAVAKEDPQVALITLSKMTLGDVVIMHPAALHRSSVKPWHSKTRLSLDLRLFPRKD